MPAFLQEKHDVAMLGTDSGHALFGVFYFDQVFFAGPGCFLRSASIHSPSEHQKIPADVDQTGNAHNERQLLIDRVPVGLEKPAVVTEHLFDPVCMIGLLWAHTESPDSWHTNRKRAANSRVLLFSLSMTLYGVSSA